MRRSRSFRLFAALFAPWFALVVAEPVPLHDCPMHSLHPAAAHGMESSHAQPAGERDMSAMPHVGMEPSKTAHDRDAPGRAPMNHQCCCMGACCASALAPVARVSHLAWVPTGLRSEVAPPFRESFAPASVAHVLPFANGPPAARV